MKTLEISKIAVIRMSYNNKVQTYHYLGVAERVLYSEFYSCIYQYLWKSAAKLVHAVIKSFK